MTNIIQGFKQITVMTNKSAIIHVDNTIIYMIWLWVKKKQQLHDLTNKPTTIQREIYQIHCNQ